MNTGISYESKKFVSVKEIAEILNVPISWIYQRTRLGQEGIPHIALGKYRRFDPDEVLAFFRAEAKRPAEGKGFVIS